MKKFIRFFYLEFSLVWCGSSFYKDFKERINDNSVDTYVITAFGTKI